MSKKRETKVVTVRRGQLTIPRGTRVSGARILTPETHAECYLDTWLIRQLQRDVVEYEAKRKPSKSKSETRAVPRARRDTSANKED